MSLVDLSLQALIAQAVQKFGVNSITSRTILKLNPEISRIVGIEQNLLEVICNWNLWNLWNLRNLRVGTFGTFGTLETLGSEP